MTFLVVRGQGKENTNKRYTRDNTRLILVFRPPKNNDLTPPLIQGLEHYYLN
jgi:hypothetical protein